MEGDPGMLHPPPLWLTLGPPSVHDDTAMWKGLVGCGKCVRMEVPLGAKDGLERRWLVEYGWR